MFDKKGLKNKIIFGLFILAIMFAVSVIAEPPGIQTDDKYTEYPEGNTTVTFFANATSDPWVYLTNVTLFFNASLASEDRDTGVKVENLTVSLADNPNGTSNLSLLIETVDFDLTSLVGDGEADGYYIHYYFESCGANVTDYPVGASNSTECGVSNNASIYLNPAIQPSRTPPIIDLITPIEGNDDDGLVTFNISMTATDSQTLEGGNLTLLLNSTGAGDQTGCGATTSFCDKNSNVTYNFSETIELTTTQTFFSVTFNETAQFGSVFSDNITIFWSGYGCTNATAPGNCSYATGNQTLTISYATAEITAPTFDGITFNDVDANNGTVLNTRTLTVKINVTDAQSLVQNVTLQLNATNSTASFIWDKDVNVNWIDNETIDVIAASQSGISFNLTNLISQEIWYDSAGGETTFPVDGFLNLRMQITDNQSNIAYTENYTLEFDLTAPPLTTLDNYTLTNGTCQTATVNFLLGEDANATGYYYDILSGEADNRTFTDVNSFSNNISMNLTTLVNNRRYDYNISTCDAHGNCGTNDVQSEYKFDWSLCEGWSQYGILTSSVSLSGIANDTNADSVAVWNESAGSFATFTTASPSLGNDNVLVGRGDGILINVPHDNAWIRTFDGNVTLPSNDNNDAANDFLNTSGINVNLTAGWNHIGLLVTRTPENITYGQNPSFTATADTDSNITFISTYNNNLSESVYRDYVFGRTLNANMTYPMAEGYAPWIYVNISLQWINRTAVEV